MTGELLAKLSEAVEQGLEVQGVGIRKGAGSSGRELTVPAILEEARSMNPEQAARPGARDWAGRRI